jgi:hypothetical protein
VPADRHFVTLPCPIGAVAPARASASDDRWSIPRQLVGERNNDRSEDRSSSRAYAAVRVMPRLTRGSTSPQGWVGPWVKIPGGRRASVFEQRSRPAGLVVRRLVKSSCYCLSCPHRECVESATLGEVRSAAWAASRTGRRAEEFTSSTGLERIDDWLRAAAWRGEVAPRWKNAPNAGLTICPTVHHHSVSTPWHTTSGVSSCARRGPVVFA